MSDRPLTVAECRAALFGMALRKSPGCDGFPAEFYIKFWDILGDDLVDVLNFCFSSGYLTGTQRPLRMANALIPATGAPYHC